MEELKLSSMGQLALSYAQAGITVFPFDPLTKRPYKGFNDWPNRATTNLKTVTNWWIVWPEAMVASPTYVNGFWVLDIDAGNGKTGLESLRLLEKEFGEIKCNVVVRSPNGGLHFYFSVPESGEIKNSESLIAPYIDVRAKGGAIILPGSVRPQGKYEIVHDWRKQNA